MFCEKCQGMGYIIIPNKHGRILGDAVICPACWQMTVLKACGFPKKYYEKVHPLSDFKANISSNQMEIIEKFISEFPNPQKKGFYFYGSKGTGKTSICATIISILYQNKDLVHGFSETPKFSDIADMFQKIRNNFDNSRDSYYGIEGNSEILEDAQEREIYIFDDFGAMNISKWVLEQLFIIFNSRYSNGKISFITSNLSINEIWESVQNSKCDSYEKKNFERMIDRWQEDLNFIKFGEKNYRREK